MLLKTAIRSLFEIDDNRNRRIKYVIGYALGEWQPSDTDYAINRAQVRFPIEDGHLCDEHVCNSNTYICIRTVH